MKIVKIEEGEKQGMEVRQTLFRDYGFLHFYCWMRRDYKSGDLGGK
jgi:hypothetical protein